MTEVFLSHASRDVRKARRIKAVVEEHGISVWFILLSSLRFIAIA